METVDINAYVSSIEGNRTGHLSEKIVVTAHYECSNIFSSISFNVPIKSARNYYVGQEINIRIKIPSK